MARFAKDIINRMEILKTSKLVPLLGPETLELKLRVGINSGAVTAGVLRGDRARFQLFGDTVNTASRMESLGLPGVIHASEETAKILIDAGKGSWLTEREGGVEAKGKGVLRTFFVAPKSMDQYSSSASFDLGSETASSSEVQPVPDDEEP